VAAYIDSVCRTTPEQCDIHTSTRISPANFDTINVKIILVRYLIHCYSLQTLPIYAATSPPI